MIDQINKLHEDGLTSLPEKSRYTENKWISKKKSKWVVLLTPYWYIDNIHYTPMITLEKSIQNTSLATDEWTGPKWALNKGWSRENIESLLRVWFKLSPCNLLAMIWASWLPDPVDH